MEYLYPTAILRSKVLSRDSVPYWIAAIIISLVLVSLAEGKTQQYQEISMANQQELRKTLDESANIISSFSTSTHAVNWMLFQSLRLKNKIPDERVRRNLLRMIHYEATRFSLNPDLVLALIEVESGFNRFALSPVGASGLMQVMPFWKDLIGNPKDSLFDVRTNLRYGCIILRHYLDIEKDDIGRGLARYNGSLGEVNYSQMVLGLWGTKYRFVNN